MLLALASAALAAPLVAGRDHTCLLRDGAVWCWGDGQATPARVPALEGVVDLASGADHVCARAADGATGCFRVGGGAPVALGATDAVAAGDELTCASGPSGVTCFGRLRTDPPPPPPPASGGGALGGMGMGSFGRSAEPKPARPAPPGGARPVDVPREGLAVSGDAVCGLTGGAARCVGRDAAGDTWGAFTLPVADVRAVVAADRRWFTLDAAGTVRSGVGSGPQTPVAAGGRLLDRVDLLVGGGGGWCARRAGEVWCATAGLPERIPAFDAAVALAPGARHACALAADGAVACVGEGLTGALGTGVAARADAGRVAGLRDVVGIAAGDAFTCAARAGAPPVCWGDLGDAAPGVPTPVAGLGDATAIAAGEAHACALVGGRARCWGDDRFGQLGDGEGRPPGHVPLPGKATALDLGDYDGACAIVEGTPWCWGRGGGPEAQPISGATAIATDLGRRCVIADGEVRCGPEGSAPATVAGTKGATAVAVGLSADCAVVRGRVACWDREEPTVRWLDGVTDAVAVDTAGGPICATRRSGEIHCWEISDGVAVGRPGESDLDHAVIAGLRGRVASLGRDTCALGDDGGLACVGEGVAGIFGDGVRRDPMAAYAEEVPTAARGVARAADLVDVSFGAGLAPHACAVDRAGAVWCWGDDLNSAVLRDAPSLPALAPVRVGGLPPGIVDVAVGDASACARTAAGEVWCWGPADDGIAPPRTAPGAPILLPGPADALWAGAHTGCARSGGGLWCWGWNPTHDDRGSEDGDPLTSGVPGRIPTAGAPTAVGVGGFGVCVAGPNATTCVGTDFRGSLGPDPEPLPDDARWAVPPPPEPEPRPEPEPVPGTQALPDAQSSGLLQLLGASPDLSGVWTGSGLLGDVDGFGQSDDLGSGGAPEPARPGPQRFDAPVAATDLSQGFLGTCAVATDGALTCWGGGDPAPREVAREVVDVAVGDELACFVTRAGGVSCWTASGGPAPVPGVSGAVEVAVGAKHACARLRDGSAACWGDDAAGQLGRGRAPVAREPAPVAPPPDW